jgi:GTP 3',8-cyclase
MKDKTGRLIDYMRISITDRCNLRCVYCMPPDGVESLGHEEILRFEEILKVVSTAVSLGINKIKITGGEPLVRKGAVDLIQRIKQLEGIQAVTLTTNGILFSECAEELRQAGLDGVNFSLDSVDTPVYRSITGTDAADKVLQSVELACSMGFKTKVNCVPIRGMNDCKLEEVAFLAKRLPVDVRYIELMPIGLGKGFEGVGNKEILQMLTQAFGQPILTEERRGNGPAVYYDFPDFMGKIGFISAISSGFCGGCNRVRLTSDGFLKGCLCSNRGVALKPLLRGGASTEALGEAIRAAIEEKPQAHSLQDENGAAKETKKMFQIGG